MPEQCIIEYKEVVLPLLKAEKYLDAINASNKALKKVQKDLKKTNPGLIQRIVTLHNTMAALWNKIARGSPGLENLKRLDSEKAELISYFEAL